MDKEFPLGVEHIANGHILTIKLSDGDHKFYIPYCQNKAVVDDVKIMIGDIRKAMEGQIPSEKCMERQRDIQPHLAGQSKIDCGAYCIYLATLNMKKDVIPIMCWNPLGNYATLFSRSWDGKDIKQLRVPMALNGKLYEWLGILEVKY